MRIGFRAPIFIIYHKDGILLPKLLFFPEVSYIEELGMNNVYHIVGFQITAGVLQALNTTGYYVNSHS